MSGLFKSKTTKRLYAVLIILAPIISKLTQWKIEQPVIEMLPLAISGVDGSIAALLALLMSNPFAQPKSGLEVPRK
jgi:hypothetical protein